MLAASKNVLFPGHNYRYWWPNTCWHSGDNQCVGSSVPVVSRWLWPGNRTYLEEASMGVTMWIVTLLLNDITSNCDNNSTAQKDTIFTDTSSSKDYKFYMLMNILRKRFSFNFSFRFLQDMLDIWRWRNANKITFKIVYIQDCFIRIGCYLSESNFTYRKSLVRIGSHSSESNITYKKFALNFDERGQEAILIKQYCKYCKYWQVNCGNMCLSCK